MTESSKDSLKIYCQKNSGCYPLDLAMTGSLMCFERYWRQCDRKIPLIRSTHVNVCSSAFEYVPAFRGFMMLHLTSSPLSLSFCREGNKKASFNLKLSDLLTSLWKEERKRMKCESVIEKKVTATNEIRCFILPHCPGPHKQ